MKKEKLAGRDLIMIGIFNAVAIVIYMIIAITAATTIIGGMLATGLSFFVTGTVYMLVAVKVQKRGVFLISGILLGIIGLSSGHLPHALASMLGGLIAEIIVSDYKNKIRMLMSLAAFAFLEFLGTFLPAFILGEAYLIKTASKYGMTVEMVKDAMHFLTLPWLIGFSVFTIVMAFLGGWIGSKILKKHFVKAGLVNE